MDLQERVAAVDSEWARISGGKSVSADGRLGARARMARLFDAGSFAETGAFVTSHEGLLQDGAREPESAVCGYGAVNGRLVFAFAQDGGALGLAGAKKISALCRMAVKNGAPIVGMYDSNGARLCEGSDALAAYGKVLKAVSRAQGVVPQIAVIAGVCAGGLAAAACAADFVVMEETRGSLSVSPVSALCEMGADKSSGTAAAAAEAGLVSLTAKGDEAALDAVRGLLDYLPSNRLQTGSELACADSPERATASLETLLASGERTAAGIAALLCDGGKLITLHAAYAPEALTALCSFGGIVCGIAATDPAVNGGRLTAAGAEKLASFIILCDGMNLPVVTLCDCAGFDCADEANTPAFARSLSLLALAYAKADIPLVTMITGHATGSAFALLGSKALGADVVLALPSAEIGVMEAESAVQFLWNDKLAASSDAAAEKAKLIADWERSVATPIEAAKAGHIDFVCRFSEARARIAASLSMLAMKTDFAALS